MAIVAGGKFVAGRYGLGPIIMAGEVMMFLGKAAVHEDLSRLHNQIMFWRLKGHEVREHNDARRYCEEQAIKYQREYNKLVRTLYEKK